jgi:hypothetical protein
MNYRIHAWCARCDKIATVIAPIIPTPHIMCHACLRDDNKVFAMRIIAAEQTPERTEQ